MKITHIFRSGNDCIITVPEGIAESGFHLVRVEWENYPPSKGDLREYSEQVYPQKVLPAMRRIIENRGPGYWLEVMPGVRAWVSVDENRN